MSVAPLCRHPGPCDCPNCAPVDVPAAPVPTSNPLARLTVALPASAAERIAEDRPLMELLLAWQERNPRP